MQPAVHKTPKPRRVTWRRVVVGLLVLLTLLAAGLAHTAAHLEAPWLRQRVRSAVRDALHIDVDYQRARLGYNGIELRGLSLASPPPDRDLAPELLHVDRLTLCWNLADLLPHRLRHVEIDIAGVALNVVLDRQGVSSLERLLAALPPTPQKPPTPLSQLFGALHTAPLVRVDVLHIGGVRARVARREAQSGVQHVYLGELTLDGAGQTGPDAGVTLRLAGAHLQLETTGLAPDAALAPALDLLPWLAPLRSGTGVLPLTWVADVQLAADRLTLATRLEAGAQSLLHLELAAEPRLQTRELWVSLTHLDLLDWLALQAEVRVDDARSRADVDLTLAVDVPPAALPAIDFRGAKLALAGRGLHLTRDPSALALAGLRLELETPGATLARAHVGSVHLLVNASLAGGADLAGDASLTVARATAQEAAGDVTATDAGFTAQWRVAPGGVTLSAEGKLDLRARTADGEETLRATVRTRLAAGAADLASLLRERLAALRFLSAEVALQRGALVAHGERLAWDELGVAVALPPLARETPTVYRMAAAGSVQVSAAHVLDNAGEPLVDLASATATLTDARIDLETPLRSTGTVHLQLTGLADASGEIAKQVDEVSWNLVFELGFSLVDRIAPLAALRTLVDWRILHVTGHSKGHATQLSGLPVVTQDSVFSMTNLKLPRRAEVHRLDVSLRSEGQGLRQVADFALNADIARIGPLRPGGKLTATGHLDHNPATRRVAMKLEAKGPRGLDALLDLQGRAEGGNLAYTVLATARNVAAFLRGLSAADRGALCLLDPDLAAKLDAKGSLTGGAQVFDQKRPAGLDGHHAVSLAVASVACKRPQGTVSLTELDLALDATLHKGAGQADVRISLPDLDAAAGKHALQLEELEQHVAAELRIDGTVHLAADGKLGRLTQDALPTVPVRDLTWLVRGWSGPEGARLERFELVNPPTGTRLELHGGLDRAALRPPKVTDADVNGLVPATLPTTAATDTTEPVPGRLGLNVMGALRQDLAALAHDNAQVTARGVVTVPIRLESGDLVVFHTEARVHFDHVDFGLPKAGLLIQDVHGDMPIVETFTLVPQFQLLGGGEDDAYARWRFSEHQPFLRRSDFLSIAKIRYADTELGPIAGNAGIDRDVFRMDQLEATLLHGQVTGQCMVLLNGEDTHVQLRGNATGLQVAGSDERFDANAALDFLPARRALDGRAEILNIGRKHLEALLNLWDPYGEDAQSNRLRTFLRLGHPQRVRMRFQHGFMDVGVELGGLSGVVQIDELRGIALGPVFQRWLDPLLEPLRALRVQEAPKP